MPRIKSKLDSLPLRRPHRLEHNGAAIVVIRTEESVVAFLDVCPHAGWRLSEGELVDGYIECPGHGWQFNLATGQCLDVPDRVLKQVAVSRRGEWVRFDWHESAKVQAAARAALVRRILDVAISLAVLTVCVPLFAAGAGLIKLSSPGPVLHLQQRVGRKGRSFLLRKFRTMRADWAGPGITAAGDPRITPIGEFLRRWKIDELPQFWNVLKGEMQIIGPRPELEKFVNGFTRGQMRILSSAPGLASMAQLVYPHESELLRDHPDPEAAYAHELLPRKIAVDLNYEHTRTLRSDLKLVWALLLLVLGSKKHMDHTFRLAPVPDQRAADHSSRRNPTT